MIRHKVPHLLFFSPKEREEKLPDLGGKVWGRAVCVHASCTLPGNCSGNRLVHPLQRLFEIVVSA